jgi:hypothetical protein
MEEWKHCNDASKKKSANLADTEYVEWSAVESPDLEALRSQGLNDDGVPGGKVQYSNEQ